MLPKDADGIYYYSIGGVYFRLPAGLQGEKTMQKLKTAQAIVSTVQSLALATDDADNLVKEYFDAGTFTDEDLAALGITAAQLAACITLLEQVDKLMTNQATSTADFTATLNSVRRV